MKKARQTQRPSERGLVDQAVEVAEKAVLNADQLRTILECALRMRSETIGLSASRIAQQLTGQQSVSEIERILARELRSAARRVNRVIASVFRNEPPGAE